MSVTVNDIPRIAHLARLKIAADKIPQYVEHLNNLLKLVEEMNQVNTDNITPMSHPLEGETQRLRSDNITEKDTHASLQKIAPHVVEDLYIVPKVIE
jgi:aspartyl-tRNA(Asn)/glutamyl-tRNA(Gln) amidotransferase subunit C